MPTQTRLLRDLSQGRVLTDQWMAELFERVGALLDPDQAFTAIFMLGDYAPTARILPSQRLEKFELIRTDSDPHLLLIRITDLDERFRDPFITLDDGAMIVTEQREGRLNHQLICVPTA